MSSWRRWLIVTLWMGTGCVTPPDQTSVIPDGPSKNKASIEERVATFGQSSPDVNEGLALVEELRKRGRWTEAERVLTRLWEEGFRQRPLLHAIHNVGIQTQSEFALDALQIAVTETPDDGAIWNLLGVQQLIRGALPEARESFQKAAERDDVDPEVIANLARVEIRLRDADAAEASITRYEQSVGTDLTSHRVRAQIASLRNDGEGAESHLRAAYALEPNVLTRRELADMLVRVGKYEEAISHYKALQNEGADTAVLHGNLAYAHLSRGHTEFAIQSARASLAKSANYGPAWRTLGRAQQRARDYGSAATSLHRAVRCASSPAEEARSRYYLGELHWTLEEFEASRVEFRRVAETLATANAQLAARIPDEGSLPTQDEASRLREICAEVLGDRSPEGATTRATE